jgi:predicted secreted protein
MAFINGKDKILYLDTGRGFFPIGCLTTNGMDESVEMLDTTTRDNTNGWSTGRPTRQNYNVSFDGLITQEVSSTTLVTYVELRQAKRDRQLISWKIDDGAGQVDQGQGYIVNLSDSAAIDEYVSFSGSITGYGKPTDTISTIYDDYETRSILGGGLMTSESCQKTFILNITAE